MNISCRYSFIVAYYLTHMLSGLTDSDGKLRNPVYWSHSGSEIESVAPNAVQLVLEHYNAENQAEIASQTHIEPYHPTVTRLGGIVDGGQMLFIPEPVLLSKASKLSLNRSTSILKWFGDIPTLCGAIESSKEHTRVFENKNSTSSTPPEANWKPIERSLKASGLWTPPTPSSSNPIRRSSPESTQGILERK